MTYKKYNDVRKSTSAEYQQVIKLKILNMMKRKDLNCFYILEFSLKTFKHIKLNWNI